MEVIPEVVHYDEEIDYYGMSYSELIPLLIQSIKEQQVIIQNQQQEIDEIQSLIGN